MSTAKRFAVILLLAGLPWPPAVAQEGATASASDSSAAVADQAPPPPCTAAEHRQFDFWLGSWRVTQGDAFAGTNRIESILGGCVLFESWQGAKGSVGHSYNVFDAARGVWHQTWVDASGTLLQLDGGLVDGAMVLSGVRPARDGKGEVQHRITWTPLKDGSVRQHWQASRDGQSWQDLFDGVYRRSDEAP